MADRAISTIMPFFIVRDVPAALAFYRDRLGFEITYQGPPGDIFFGMVARDGASIMFKALGVEPVPNFKRRPALSWDAYVDVLDPDALAAEFASRGVTFAEPLQDRDDGLRGFTVEDGDGYGLYFGRYSAEKDTNL
jgi:uncharacterized glyoxalase superfamily protein PhnB